MQSLVVDRPNGDGEDTIGVSIKIALVIGPAAVAACENEYRALAAAAVLDAL